MESYNEDSTSSTNPFLYFGSIIPIAAGFLYRIFATGAISAVSVVFTFFKGKKKKVSLIKRPSTPKPTKARRKNGVTSVLALATRLPISVVNSQPLKIQNDKNNQANNHVSYQNTNNTANKPINFTDLNIREDQLPYPVGPQPFKQYVT